MYIRSVFDLEPYMVELGHKFQEHDMRRHLEHLRRYYREHRRRARVQAARAGVEAWEVDLVLTWLFLFQISPFEHFYGELAEGGPCPCGQKHAYNRGGVSFPGGRTWTCAACTREWLVRMPLSRVMAPAHEPDRGK